MSRNTVKSYLRQKGWNPYQKPVRKTKLLGLNNWLQETFKKHKGNAAVVHQELIRQHGITLDKSTVRKRIGLNLHGYQTCFRKVANKHKEMDGVYAML